MCHQTSYSCKSFLVFPKSCTLNCTPGAETPLISVNIHVCVICAYSFAFLHTLTCFFVFILRCSRDMRSTGSLSWRKSLHPWPDYQQANAPSGISGMLFCCKRLTALFFLFNGQFCKIWSEVYDSVFFFVTYQNPAINI